MNTRPKLILVGGFLGAGKTTAILAFAQWLTRRRQRVAIITNDQAVGLVDTALARKKFLVEEISGGCFCCRSQVFEKTIRKLTEELRPNVVIAEPVGSCTDLVATVVKPLQSIYKTPIDFAPFSVMVDPFNALRMFDGEPGRGFAPEIKYIQKKQMEEAEILVVNKRDIFPLKRVKSVDLALSDHFPNSRRYSISARTGDGCLSWFNAVFTDSSKYQPVMEVDYEKYARGEELLGWFNGSARVSGLEGKKFNPKKVLQQFAAATHAALERHGALIAHFKVILQPAGSMGFHEPTPLPSGRPPGSGRRENEGPEADGYCVMQIAGPDAPILLRGHEVHNIANGQMTINLRAQAQPVLLSSALSEAANAISHLAVLKMEQSESFAPAKPTPTHRLV